MPPYEDNEPSKSPGRLFLLSLRLSLEGEDKGEGVPDNKCCLPSEVHSEDRKPPRSNIKSPLSNLGGVIPFSIPDLIRDPGGGIMAHLNTIFFFLPANSLQTRNISRHAGVPIFSIYYRDEASGEGRT
jgi:hypothetical protein